MQSLPAALAFPREAGAPLGQEGPVSHQALYTWGSLPHFHEPRWPWLTFVLGLFFKEPKCVCVDSLIAFLIYLVTAKPDRCLPLWGCTAACIPACGQGLAASPAQSWARQPWAGHASLSSGHHTLPHGFTVQQMLGTFVPDRWNLPGLGRLGVPWGVPSAQEGWPCSVL